jgi:hypothetical protein
VPPLAFFDGLGLGEMVICAIVALLLFGGRLPEAMGKLGGTYRKLRRGLDDLKRTMDAPPAPRAPYRPSTSTPISSGVGEPPRPTEPSATPPAPAPPPVPDAGTPPAPPPPRVDDAPPV